MSDISSDCSLVQAGDAGSAGQRRGGRRLGQRAESAAPPRWGTARGAPSLMDGRLRGAAEAWVRHGGSGAAGCASGERRVSHTPQETSRHLLILR
eukprot:6668332-Prymnesium_polylepis.1